MGPFQQAETNVAGHVMSSLEASRWRSDDVDPTLLQHPLDVSRQLEAEQAQKLEEQRQKERREQRSRGYADLEVGVEMFDV